MGAAKHYGHSAIIMLLLLAAVNSAPGQTITWTQKTDPGANYPGATGYSTNLYDHAAQKFLVPGVSSGNGSIYVNSWWHYDPVNNLFAHIPESGDPSHSGGCRTATASVPYDVHPYRQVLVDTSRNRLVQINGANQGCASTNQHYHMSLNANPASDAWSQASLTNVPGIQVEGAMIHDSDADVYFLYGGSYDNWVYCPAASLSADQTAAGCVNPQEWVQVTPQNGTVTIVGGTTLSRVSGDNFTEVMKAGDYVRIAGAFYQIASIESNDSLTLASSAGSGTGVGWHLIPLARTSVTLHYDATTQRAIFYGGANLNQDTTYNTIWGYDVPGKKWRHLAMTGTQPTIDCAGTGCNGEAGQNIGQTAISFKQSTNQLFYHCVAGTGCPQDWVYNTQTDAWTQLSVTGIGSDFGKGVIMAYSPACDCLLTYAASGGVGADPEIWVGQITAQAAANHRMRGSSKLQGSGSLQ